MRHKILTAVVCAATVAAAPAAAQQTQRFSAGKATEYALVYSLPVTVLDITVETEHTVKTPGEFQNYAKRYLSTDDAIRQASSQVRVKSISINARGMANPDERYAAQFKPGTNVSMLLSEAGVPLAINVEEAPAPAAPVLPKAVDAKPTPLETPAATQAITQDISRASSPSKKAELMSQRIFELREQRNDLISGNVDNMPVDNGAMQVAIDNMAAQEAALYAMFTGTTKTFTRVQTVSFTPGKTDSTGVVLTRISPLEGAVDVSDLSGIPLTLDFRVDKKAVLPTNEKGEEKKFPKGGVAYMIPGTGTVTLSFNGRKIASETFDLAQLGVVFGLDPALFTDKKAPCYAEFSPVTGAVTRLDVIPE